MADIRQLDEQTVERIAAGEVVERPASVVKELIENSLDADADRVEVAVEAGGTAGIRVTDDGIGMTEDELRRAVEQHTTSKIEDIGDLEGGVGSLGFRGEALHAIGAVSRVTITSRPRGDDTVGTAVTVEGGEVTSVERAGTPVGTTVEVRDLFYNVPARRKYLKQDATEFAHVNTIVSGYALANPDVAVSLTHDDRETFATAGRGNLRAAVMAVYGREVAEGMLAVEGESLPDGPLDSVSGLVSHPETNRASRDYLSTFVNGRYVTAGPIREAIVDAYDTQLASDRYPFAVLDLTVDPGTVDVNVHPRKLEVRFADTETVQAQISTVVEETLLSEGLVRSSAPRGESAPAQTEISPGTGDDQTPDGTAQEGESSVSDSRDEAGAATSESSTPTRSAADDGWGGEDDAARERPTTRDASDRPHPPRASESGDPSSDNSPQASQTGGESQQSNTAGAGKFSPVAEQTGLSGDRGGMQAFESLPSMRILGQLHDTYIVAETDDGLVLVDQHAADERINYERLQSELGGTTTTQALADPVEVTLTAREAGLFDAHEAALARLGFTAELVGERTVEVRAVPTLVAEAAGPELIRDVLAELVSGEAAAAETVEAAADDLLADLACYPSVTGNTSLTEGSVVDLLARLDDCENPYACPHGRPVIIEFESDEIEARFERDYPGHGG